MVAKSWSSVTAHVMYCYKLNNPGIIFGRRGLFQNTAHNFSTSDSITCSCWLKIAPHVELEAVPACRILFNLIFFFQQMKLLLQGPYPL